MVDVSWLSEGMPFFAFALVFVLSYAMLTKTKILGGGNATNAIVSFILAIIFMSFSGIREYLSTVVPWFTVLATVAFFFLFLIAFLLKDDWTKLTKPLTIVFIIIFAIILIVTFFYKFPDTQAYLPGANEAGANEFLLSIKHFLLGEKFLGGALLLIIALIVGFIITR